jgi:hypothetical protein
VTGRRRAGRHGNGESKDPKRDKLGELELERCESGNSPENSGEKKIPNWRPGVAGVEKLAAFTLCISSRIAQRFTIRDRIII